MNFSEYTVKEVGNVLKEFKTSEKGLDLKEAQNRLSEYGFNELKGKEVIWWEIFLRQFKSPFIYLLFAAAFLAFFLEGPLDGGMIILFVAINTFLGFFQEYHSEKTLKLLRQFVVSEAKVIRNVEETTIDSKELVPGDVLVVEPGDIIPADIRFFKTEDLTIDESILTGESAPVRKISDILGERAEEIYKAQNIGFSGTTVVTGRGIGVIVATGKQTAIGNITKLTVETVKESSFEKELLRFSKFILRLVLITLAVLIFTNFLIKSGNVNITKLLIFSIALAVSVIPEALPIVTTFSLSRGALRLAKHKVVVKRLSSVEDLGSIEILCTDKTGTLTENKLTVDEIYGNNPEEVILYGNLSSSSLKHGGRLMEAFDLALFNYLSPKLKEQIPLYKKTKEIPFDPERRRKSVIVSYKGKKQLVVRGAPEIILGLSSNINEKGKYEILNWISDKGKKGERVLGVGIKPVDSKFSGDENSLKFIGIISFVDPLKPTATGAIEKARKMGVNIKVLTGDSREVAGSVAYNIGLIESFDEVITGEEFEKLKHIQKKEAVEKYNVFARVSPQQKYSIIQVLEEKYEVGFLGEGINDAPALKTANVGLVVQNASDIARNTADIVLLQKSLNVVVDGIHEGREIFANTTKYITATLASNFGNFYAVAISSLLINYLPMLPLQILLVNLLSDFPMIAIATDNVDLDELREPNKYSLKDIVLIASVLGIVSTFFDFIFFAVFSRISPPVLQTSWFIGSILTELVFIFSIRTKFFFLKAKRPSLSLILLTSGAALATIILPFTTFGQVVFSFLPSTTERLFLIIDQK